MLGEALSLYEAWDLDRGSMPPRSRLYPLDPIGLCTPEAESLTSYISRLAGTYDVHPGMFFISEIDAVANIRQQFSRREGSRGGIGTINGAGKMAARTATALETLTCRTDLRFLTLVTYAHVLPRTKLIRPSRAWCPICLAEWQQADRIIHEPLLWTLQAVAICARHCCRLSLRCPHPDCGKHLSQLGWRMRPGHCARCDRWLGVQPRTSRRQTHDISEEELAWHSWVERNVGQLIAAAPTVAAPPQARRVAEALAACIDRSTGGNLMEFARRLQVPKNFVSAWRAGDVLPQLGALLRICYVARTPLLQFLTEADPATGPQGMLPPGDRPMWVPTSPTSAVEG